MFAEIERDIDDDRHDDRFNLPSPLEIYRGADAEISRMSSPAHDDAADRVVERLDQFVANVLSPDGGSELAAISADS